jgi:hypothetical protein
MQMYPAYTLRQVLDLYAISFFTLLGEGYRIKAEHYFMLAQVSAVTIMTDAARDEFFDKLQLAAQDPSDKMVADEYSGIDDIKRIFKRI